MTIYNIAADHSAPRISVFGIGGAGGNAVASLVERPLSNVRVIAANTDAQALRGVAAHARLRLGRGTTGGLGAGASPAVGRIAASEALPDIDALLVDTDLCFLAAGMGGGTGTGAAPVIAAAARARGIPTVAIVTMPFHFEGSRRAGLAEAGLAALEAQVDAVIVVPNQNLFRTGGPGVTFRSALREADRVLIDGVCSVVELVSNDAVKHVGFADLKAMLSGLGRAVIGFGESRTLQGRARRAADQAMASPHLENDFAEATRVIVAIRGGEDMGLIELEEIVSRITARAAANVELVWGATIAPGMTGALRVSVIAEGGAMPASLLSLAPRAVQAPVEPDIWMAPAPPLDLDDFVRRPGAALANPAQRTDRWVRAVSPASESPRAPVPAETDLQLMSRQIIARHHPSLINRAGGGMWSVLESLVGRQSPLRLPRAA